MKSTTQDADENFARIRSFLRAKGFSDADAEKAISLARGPESPVDQVLREKRERQSAMDAAPVTFKQHTHFDRRFPDAARIVKVQY
jgi:hypothetical protein